MTGVWKGGVVASACQPQSGVAAGQEGCEDVQKSTRLGPERGARPLIFSRRRSGEISRRHYSFIFLNQTFSFLNQTFSFPRNRRYRQASNCPDDERRINPCALVSEKEDPCLTRD
jgi:hypothetical protein